MNIPERISALRALMEERGYDVYMVPTYVLPELLSSQRMKQASGLTEDIFFRLTSS